MKKLLSLLFTAALVFSLAMPVFAQDTGTQEAPKETEQKTSAGPKKKKTKEQPQKTKAPKAKRTHTKEEKTTEAPKQ